MTLCRWRGYTPSINISSSFASYMPKPVWSNGGHCCPEVLQAATQFLLLRCVCRPNCTPHSFECRAFWKIWPAVICAVSQGHFPVGPMPSYVCNIYCNDNDVSYWPKEVGTASENVVFLFRKHKGTWVFIGFVYIITWLPCIGNLNPYVKDSLRQMLPYSREFPNQIC